jgi:O-antigen/teichoic acid export membrane protein
LASLSSRIISGSFLFLMANFIQRSIGLISTLILARILTPDDFGIVAISSLIIHLCDVLSNAGSESYIIQKSDLDKEDINSAWTLDVLLKLGLWVLLIIAIPFVSDFYQQAELTDALYVSSLVLLIGGVKSPSIAILKRDLNYKKIFFLNVIRKVLSFSIVIGVVYYDPSYWAIIIGDVTAAIVLTVGSYFIYSYKPSFSTDRIREQFAFSKWILLKSGVGYSRAQLDVFFVGKLFSADLLGAYHVARQLTIMPSSDIIAPAIEPLLASFTTVKNDINRLNFQLSVSFIVVSGLVIPAALYMWFYPNVIVDLLLGSQWGKAYELLSALSILLVSISISQLMNPYYVAAGKVKAIFYYDLLSFIFIFLFLYVFKDLSLYNFALMRGALSVPPLLLMMIYIRFITHLSILRLCLLVLPAVLAAYFGIVVVSLLYSGTLGNVIYDFLFTMGVFGALYAGCLVGLYKFYYQRFVEWQYLGSLISTGLGGVLARIKR